MSELLENLLQWSRSQYGVIHCNPVSVDISKLAGQSVEYYRQNATRKNISLKINIPEGTMVCADENMVRCILRNLVGNAVKFTRQGGEVNLTAQREDQSIMVSIKDNGVGIEKEKLDNLFKLGENPTSNGTAKEKGSGLGLILCKEFVEKNGGKIEVLSEVGEGSLFRFSLPLPVST